MPFHSPHFRYITPHGTLPAEVAIPTAADFGLILLQAGLASSSAQAAVERFLHAVGVEGFHVDITFTALSISSTSGHTQAMRTVSSSSINYLTLAHANGFLQDVEDGRIPVSEAPERVADLSKPARHSLIRLVGWGFVAATLCVALGANFLSAGIAGVTVMFVQFVLMQLSARGWPDFFISVIGGLLSTSPVIGLYMVGDWALLVTNPTRIAAASLISLLVGLSALEATQDAIMGMPVTASAKLFNAFLNTFALIGGISAALWVASELGVVLPDLSQTLTPTLPHWLAVAAAGCSAGGYAFLNNASPKAVSITTAAGTSAFGVYLLAANYTTWTPLAASGAAALLGGFLATTLSHMNNIPRQVVAFSSVIPLLPGLALFRGVYRLLLSPSPIDGFAATVGAFLQASTLAAALIAGMFLATPLAERRIVRRVVESIPAPLQGTPPRGEPGPEEGERSQGDTGR